MNIDDISDEFLLYIKKVKNLGDKTINCYSESIKMFVQVTGCSTTENADEKVCAGFVKHLSTSGFSPSTINRHISALRQFFSYAIKSGYIVSDPFLFIKSRKRTKKIPTFLTFEELKKLISTFKGSEDYESVLKRCIICTFVFTGIRRSELLALKCHDIDFSKNEILVHGKGRKERIVYFTNYCKAVLEEYKKIRPVSGDDYFFLDKSGSPCTSARINSIFKSLESSSFNNKEITPHVLRHSFATLLINNNVDVSYIQRLLGHSSVLSSDVYVHSNMSDMYEKYDRAFSRSEV